MTFLYHRLRRAIFIIYPIESNEITPITPAVSNRIHWYSYPTKATILNQIGGAIHGAIGAVGAVAGAVLGGGGGGGNNGQGQNHRKQAQGNDGPPSASSENVPPNSNASVMDPAYVLTDSISDRLGVNNPQKEQEVDGSQEEEEEEEDIDKNEERQAPHPLFDTTADRMPYAPGQQQILGDSTIDRLQLPVADGTTRDGTTLVSEETTEASGRGYSTGEESSPFLSSFGSFTNDGTPTSPSPASMHPTRSEEDGLDASALSPITNVNSTHIHRASIASPNLHPHEGTAGHEDRELEKTASINGNRSTSEPPSGLDISAQDHNGSHTDDDNFPTADDSMLETLDTEGDTTDSVDDETDPETSTSTTRSGRNYASTSTIVRSTRNAGGSKRKDFDQPDQTDTTTKRQKSKNQSQQISNLSPDLTTPVFAVKASYNATIEKFIVELQVVVDGPYLRASEEDIITLRRMGHSDTLESVREMALEKGKARSAISSGAKSESDETKGNTSNVEATELKHLQCLGPVPMTATGMYCATDAITNVLHGAAPHLYAEGLGKVLRSLCDGSEGKIDMKSLSLKVRIRMKQLRFELQKIKKVDGEKHFLNVSPLLRQEAVIDLASKGRQMLIVDYFSKRHSKARGHVVGVANGKVYDNDETTGGIFDLHAYAEREWDGVYAARIVVPRPCY